MSFNYARIHNFAFRVYLSHIISSVWLIANLTQFFPFVGLRSVAAAVHYAVFMLALASRNFFRWTARCRQIVRETRRTQMLFRKSRRIRRRANISNNKNCNNMKHCGLNETLDRQTRHRVRPESGEREREKPRRFVESEVTDHRM